jgi:hypothetical protein
MMLGSTAALGMTQCMFWIGEMLRGSRSLKYNLNFQVIVGLKTGCLHALGCLRYPEKNGIRLALCAPGGWS